MKTTAVRLFVLTLAITGFGASSLSAHARTATKASVAPLSVVGGTGTMCLPSEPGHCGLD